MRRHTGWGNRDATGGTVDTDGLPPIENKPAVKKPDAPGVYEEGIRLFDCGLSFKGHKAVAPSWAVGGHGLESGEMTARFP